MSDFVTRVELHAANSNDYEKLHHAMALQGFGRTIVGGDGRQHQLPTAEYWISSNLTAIQVRDKAKAAANGVKPTSEILTCQVADWACYLTMLPQRRAS